MKFRLTRRYKMKKLVILFTVIILAVLLCSGCKALAVNGSDEEEEINIPGTWVFANVLKDTGETHDRSFTLTGSKTSGTVTDNMAAATGTYTVTDETKFVMNLTDRDASYAWDFEYEGTILDNRNMSGTLKTTTYKPDRSEKLAEYEYDFTAKRQD